MTNSNHHSFNRTLVAAVIGLGLIQSASAGIVSQASYRSSSPVYHSDTVRANGRDVYREVFRAGEPVELFVMGDGDTDLDLYVYDENGHLICEDTDTTDAMLCNWTPRWTGVFEIRIHNLGSVYNRYSLMIE